MAMSPTARPTTVRPSATAHRIVGATERHGVWRDTERCYRAVMSRDSRFDGQFITAVRTTGIYCRPSCPALTPKAENVRFFPTSAAAQASGYRACRRCLPDAVPGSPEWNVRADLAARAMRLISDGVVEREGVPGLAQRLGYSERQLGRVLTAELGAGPLALARAHRAHSARLLIEMSELPLTDVAFAAGFSSVRQFNDTIREVFATTPSRLRAAATAARRRAGPPAAAASTGTRLTLRLPFRAPFDAAGALRFLAERAVPGVEHVSAQSDTAEGTTAHGTAPPDTASLDTAVSYARTLRLPHGTGVVRLTPADGHVRCDLRLHDVRDLGSAVARVRRLLDLDADPVAIIATLRTDPALAPLVTTTPGIRVPGAVDGPELVLRAMLGQQVSVAAARTAIARLAAELGERLPPGDEDDPDLLFPTPAAVAEHAGELLRGPRRRVEAIRAVAGLLAGGELDVHVGRDADELRAELLAAPGIGPWTADYVLMRVLGAPDVLLAGDLALRRGAAAVGITSDQLGPRAQAWRPWRSYAGRYLWCASAGADSTGRTA
ncbi:AraC family transcriptional regulator, regulatory protein of adaptative response / DNA-3-methyladenine glycosylase II [Amycolatopsis arida]|uniref:DNA-3-methyladenine glycosylase II n=2 Tax=Amycolatopsis arida TaxID=587909 RepID=A0A1I5PQ49_9PSEU|nr:AraC family transcriptional regulator of adaptative response / DNA-3-methyladenine glycosylase II [Amycolatopsis arida]SFP36027.1 AraC family transcriptional regulator, regulatory protein of adaptative response / DNA-3-methyladenine glycosylase II [Amycolatopsis arida]